ncbi:MAG: MFS transporter, partial [Elusimicrobiaceae bacterium]|nr:MFS transporter [Elusimicrobiaceae bacterium]
ERQGYSITGKIQSGLQTLQDYFYLNYIAPWWYRYNPFYQQQMRAQQALAQQATPAVAEETGEETAQQTETATAEVQEQAALAGMFTSSAFASQLLALLAAGNTSADPNQSPKKRNSLLNRYLQAKYTKILKEIQPLAKQRAIFEFLAMETDIIDSFVEDQAFLAVYHSELNKAILATKLPDAVKKLALQTVEDRMQAAAEAVRENPALAAKHKVMAIPLYHHNRIIDYWLVEPPAGFKLKENQEVYAVVGEEKGKADLFESTYKEEDRRDKIESTRLRADIPITKEGRVFATTGFGLRKVAEGLSLMINHLWPMYLIYVLAGLGNVSSTIATFAKASFTLSQQEMYIFGGVTSVVMGLSSFVVGLLQERLSRNPDGSINSSRGRLISMNIGMALCLLAFVLPMFGGIAGNMGPATEVKKQLLIASFIALGIGAAFIDVAMKPTLLSVTKKGDYQAKQGYLSVFKQVVGNMSNYVIPPLAIGLGSVIGQAWDWSVYFPIYSAVTMAILALYNAFKMHSQTLEETEFVPEKTNLWQDVKKIGTEFFGSQKYNQLFRHGVAKTIAHGANMSILGLYVNNLFKDHYPADEHTWLIHSLIMFTLPIIVGRIFGTAVMKHDLKIGNKTIIKKQNLGSMLKLSSAAVLLALAAIASGVWTLQMAGVVLAALGLTNISPIVGGYTADHTRKISNTVSAMLSATSVVTFGLAALFGTLLEWSGSPWVSFLLPAVLLSGIFLFGMEISSHRLEGEGTPEISGWNWLRTQMQQFMGAPKADGNAENPTDATDINNEEDDWIDFDGGEAPAY